MTERDENIICGVLVSSLLDHASKERLCAVVRADGEAARAVHVAKVCPAWNPRPPSQRCTFLVHTGPHSWEVTDGTC